MAQAHRRGRSPGCPGCARCATTAPTYLGPFSGARQVELATAALHEAFRLRQCTSRLSPAPRLAAPARWPRWAAAARRATARESVEAYAGHAAAVRAAMLGDVRPRRRRAVPQGGPAGRGRAVRGGRGAPRPAGRVRPRGRTAAAAVRADPVRRAGGRPASATTAAGRSSWSATAGSRPPRSPAAPRTRGSSPPSLVAAAEVVTPGHGPTPAASAEETECVLRWLEQPGIRLVSLTGTWACPDVRRRRRAAVGRGRRATAATSSTRSAAAATSGRCTSRAPRSAGSPDRLGG